MPNKKINQLDSRVISSTDLILVGDPSTGVSFKSLVSGLGLIYVPNSRTLNINGTTYDLSSNRSWSVGTVTSVNLIAGTGVSVSGGPITNSGSINIVNTAPDQIVALTGAGTAVITGTYPNFTITTNDEFDGTVTSVNLTAGTGISVSGGPITGSGSISVTNTAPDQVVSLTGAGTTTISGTYPNFTITSIDKNYVHDQQNASSSWVVVHNLNKFASVSIVDTANDEIIGDVEYNSLNQVTINFSSQVSGKAYIN